MYLSYTNCNLTFLVLVSSAGIAAVVLSVLLVMALVVNLVLLALGVLQFNTNRCKSKYHVTLTKLMIINLV